MKRLGCLALCLCLLTGCGVRDTGESAAVFAMDTAMELTAYGPQAQEALEAAAQEINRLDRLLSAQREGGDIYAVDRQEDEVRVSEETARLLEETLALCEDTGGALDVTIYPAMEAWGFYSGEYRVPGAEELAELRKRVDHSRVSVNGAVVSARGRKLDLGAVGKGYAGDRILEIWRDMGLTSGLLNLGGNVQCLGARPDGKDWSVAIRDPEDAAGTLAAVTGRDMAVVTSGSYQRYFEENGVTYHHILDPKTCAPAESGARSVTVIGPSGFVCDGLSTALFVMGPQAAADYWRERHDFDMIYYAEDGILWYTSGLKDRLTLREDLEGRMLT